jgi:hypothetical protein
MTTGNKRCYARGAMSLLVSLAMASLVWGQEAGRLEVEVSPSGQVRIFARAVSYGVVLRALEDKLGVTIEIPAEADELKLDYARIEASRPEEALARVLEGSGLGYGWLAQAHRLTKVVIVARPGEPAKGTSVSTLGPAADPLQDRSPDAVDSASFPVQTESEGTENQGSRLAPPVETWSLSEAGIVNGTEPGLAARGAAEPQINPLPAESQPTVGETPRPGVTRPLSDAANVVGIPPGVSAGDVGKTRVLPLPPPGRRP